MCIIHWKWTKLKLVLCVANCNILLDSQIIKSQKDQQFFFFNKDKQVKFVKNKNKNVAESTLQIYIAKLMKLIDIWRLKEKTLTSPFCANKKWFWYAWIEVKSEHLLLIKR